MSTPAVFAPRTIAIYSVGLLGGSLGLALKHSGYQGRILGMSSPASIKSALEIGCIDEGFGYADLASVVARSDAIFLCSPIEAIIETIGRLSSMTLPDGLVVTDVGSTKRAILDAARALPPGVTFVGGHPMTGSERSGALAGDPFLFQNAVYVITSASATPTPLHVSMVGFLEKYLGCKCVVMDPTVHDTIAATVSHVPHILAVALANLAGSTSAHVPHTLELAAGGFRDMTRIASAPYGMWHDIITTNRDLIAAKLAEYIDTLGAMRARVIDGDLCSDFSRAAQTRTAVPVRAKGLVGPLNNIVVSAPDQPGAIAAIAQVLADKSINIKDIEVLRVREGEAGTIRLAFDSPATCRHAVDVLEKSGFRARVRE